MFLKSCKGRKSCLDPIPNIFMIFKKSQQRFFSCFYFFHHRCWKFSPALAHDFCKILLKNFLFIIFIVVIDMTQSELKICKIFKTLIFSKTPKTDHPKKVDFGPFSTPLYRPIRTVFRDGAKMVIFEGSRPQNRKKALFCQKNEKWRSGRKGLKLRLALQSSSVPSLVRPIPRELCSPVCDFD